jgi:hypothetical protein
MITAPEIIITIVLYKTYIGILKVDRLPSATQDLS